MAGWALAITLVAAAATLGLGLVVISFSRQVRKLRVDVEALSQGRDRELEVHNKPESQTAVLVPDDSARGDAVLLPTPIGPAELEPDPSVARVASVTLSGPLIKVAAFSHGVRRALDEDTRMRVAYAFRKELRRQRRMRRKRTAAHVAGPPRDGGWQP